jgi:hypothetical protein
MNRKSAYGSANLPPGLAYENPMMKISIINPDDALEEPTSGDGPDTANDYADKFQIGDVISGQVAGDNDGEPVQGSVQQIIRNKNGDGMLILIQDEEGNRLHIDASTAQKIETANEPPPEINTSTYNESRYVMTFEQFNNSRR